MNMWIILHPQCTAKINEPRSKTFQTFKILLCQSCFSQSVNDERHWSRQSAYVLTQVVMLSSSSDELILLLSFKVKVTEALYFRGFPMSSQTIRVLSSSTGKHFTSPFWKQGEQKAQETTIKSVCVCVCVCGGGVTPLPLCSPCAQGCQYVQYLNLIW